MQHLQHPNYEALSPDQPTHAVLFLHGLGASGHDLMPIASWLQDRLPNAAVRWQFPHAPSQPVTLNQGMVMPAWFDLYEVSERAKEDTVGLEKARAGIAAMIAELGEVGIPASRCVVCGFSQGGALALHTALHHPEPLAGVACFSGYLPQRAQVRALQSAPTLPIWLVHGTQDAVVPLRFFERSKAMLADIGCPQLTTQTIPMAHEITPETLQYFLQWLTPLITTSSLEGA